jgi:hypothetical protein
MKRMYDLSESSIEKLKNQAQNNGRTITSELNRILNALPDVKKESETIQSIKISDKLHRDYFVIGQTYFDEDQNECVYTEEKSIVQGLFYFEAFFENRIKPFNKMYSDSACIKKVIQ